MTSTQDVVVGRPLLPETLERLKALTPLPAAGAFQARKSFAHSYRIFTCHGYVNRRNDDCGVLRIQRHPAGDDDVFRLEVSQTILYAEGAVQRIDADLRCRQDQRAGPLSWRVRQEFLRSDGTVREDLSLSESGTVAGAELVVETGGKKFRRPGSGNLAADWGLFEAVQRLPAGADFVFDLLEGMSVLKPGQRMLHRGVSEQPWSGQKLRLERFVQHGRGILPFDYWCDEHHRLVLVTTLSRAYVLDAEAVAKTDAGIEAARARQDRRRRRKEER